jgi:hypothetical protein
MMSPYRGMPSPPISGFLSSSSSLDFILTIETFDGFLLELSGCLVFLRVADPVFDENV